MTNECESCAAIRMAARSRSSESYKLFWHHWAWGLGLGYGAAEVDWWPVPWIAIAVLVGTTAAIHMKRPPSTATPDHHESNDP